jgi:nucleoside-diphosphate-sugar epimerase
MRIFLAGATGVIGRPLLALLVRAGHDVTGTTRSAAKASMISAAGAAPLVVDVFDADALSRAVVAARAEVVIHQLTDLPQEGSPAKIAAALAANARIRIEGTRNLVAAAKAAGVRRMIAQSIAFMYAPGREPHTETDALMPGGPDGSVDARGVHALEDAVTAAPDLSGIVLRYGRLYGPGTWTPVAQGRAPLHVDAAAQAALLAVTRGVPGIYNIAEDDGAVTIAKARDQLGFDPGFRQAAWA